MMERLRRAGLHRAAERYRERIDESRRHGQLRALPAGARDDDATESEEAGA
jgi:hypothetical protein